MPRPSTYGRPSQNKRQNTDIPVGPRVGFPRVDAGSATAGDRFGGAEAVRTTHVFRRAIGGLVARDRAVTKLGRVTSGDEVSEEERP